MDQQPGNFVWQPLNAVEEESLLSASDYDRAG
jgi:hypothetical protein